VEDTVTYYYRDEAWNVLTIGERWTGTSTDVEARFAELLVALTSRHGEPSLVCERPDRAWRIRDLRWVTGETHAALIMAVPLVDLGASPFVQRVAQLGPPACEDHYSVPFVR
jgi:hypothetical protein